MRWNTESIHTIYPNDCFAVVFGSQIVSRCLPRLGSSSYFWKRKQAGSWLLWTQPWPNCPGVDSGAARLLGSPCGDLLTSTLCPSWPKLCLVPASAPGLVSSCPLQSHSVSKVNAGHSFCQAENLGVYVFWHQNNDKVITLRMGSGTTCLSTGVSSFCLEQCYATVTIFCR